MINNTKFKECFLAFSCFLLIQASLNALTFYQDGSGDCESETAFAFLNNDNDLLTADEQSTCFIPEFNRWGWTTYLDFSNETGQSSYTLDIYSGAGQCDLTKGTDLGSVTITYNDDRTVTFDYNLEGFLLSQAHVYIGSDPYPIKNNGKATVAPGKYTHTDSGFDPVEDYSVSIPFQDRQFYVIVHGVTKSAECSDSPDDDCVDTDSDGICDLDDMCPGYDDNLDNDGDGIPDNCDPCLNDPNNTCGGRISEPSFNTYPVPFIDEMNIQYKFDYVTPVLIEIFTVNGVKVAEYKNNYSVQKTLSTVKLKPSHLSNQLLFVRLTTSKGQSIQKIISSN